MLCRVGTAPTPSKLRVSSTISGLDKCFFRLYHCNIPSDYCLVDDKLFCLCQFHTVAIHELRNLSLGLSGSHYVFHTGRREILNTE